MTIKDIIATLKCQEAACKMHLRVNYDVCSISGRNRPNHDPKEPYLFLFLYKLYIMTCSFTPFPQ